MPQPQYPPQSPTVVTRPRLAHPRFARVRLARRPAAVALLVLLVALSARETPPRDDAGLDGAGWPRVTAGEREAALVVAGAFDAGGAPAAPAPVLDAPTLDTPATSVRTAGGEVALEAPAGDAIDDDGGIDGGAWTTLAPPARAGYPHPVEYLTVEVDGTPAPLAFMDVSPTGPVNGRAVLILHDHDDAGDAWSATIGALAADGYRVIVPDQVGHGLSGLAGRELPAETLAAQAAILLDSIGAPRVAVVGDGLGAEVAVRLAGANAGLVERMALRPEGSAAPPAGVTLHDPVLRRALPVLVVTGEERLDPLLLGFLGL